VLSLSVSLFLYFLPLNIVEPIVNNHVYNFSHGVVEMTMMKLSVIVSVVYSRVLQLGVFSYESIYNYILLLLKNLSFYYLHFYINRHCILDGLIVCCYK